MRFIRPLQALLIAALALPASATTVASLTPEETDGLAHRIVEARVVSSREVGVSGTSITATEYELAVERVVKDDGSVASQLARHGGRLVIRQIPIVGMPEYAAGRRYRLALNGDSALGLTSPVGLGQGVRPLPDSPPATPLAGATP